MITYADFNLKSSLQFKSNEMYIREEKEIDRARRDFRRDDESYAAWANSFEELRKETKRQIEKKNSVNWQKFCDKYEAQKSALLQR